MRNFILQFKRFNEFMCGIAGILRFDGQAVDDQLLEKMNQAAHHRGPDDDGKIIIGSVGLAHKRLAIIDLNSRGRQPMVYRDSYWIVYNGEIYNYLELRSELELLGHSFRTASDTEVVLAAYTEWGEQCLKRFNGMWAFAIYNHLKGEVFFARDRFGIKPLYFARRSNALYFGSEIKQLLPAIPMRKANTRRVLDYLVTGYENHTDETFFEDVESMPAGTWMRVSLSGRMLERKAFYSLPERPEYSSLGLNEATEVIADLLHNSIQLRLRADVTIGTCLSGGLDSSAVSAIGSRIYKESGGRDFIGIHARSIERSTDESHFAAKVSKRSGIRLATVTPRSEDFARTIDEVVYTQEEPFGSPSMFMGWHVFREAQLQGCRVMLNGQGCDEAFLGYERYYPIELDPKSPVDFMRRLYTQAGNSKLSTAQALSYYFYFKHAFFRISRLRANRYIARRHLAEMAFDSVRESADSYTQCFAMQKLEIERLQLPHLLRYEDRNSMRHSVETRLPFLDYRLMEAAASLPLEHKINLGWTKYVMRKVADPHLPKEVTWRKVKLGFEAPSGVWLRERQKQMLAEISTSPMLREYVDLKRVSKDWNKLGTRYRWTMFNLAVWARVYGVSA